MPTELPRGTIIISGYEEAREALRHRALRQALYEEGGALMAPVIVNLHGDAHRARRRLENRLFRRDTFLFYEREVIPPIARAVLRPALAAGTGDLVHLARRIMMTLAAEIAGVDRPQATCKEFDRLYELMSALAVASTVVHGAGDKRSTIEEGNRALAAFEAEFFEPSLVRRAALVERFRRGDLGEEELPRDVLTVLLRNQDELRLPPDVVLREVAYFPWVGSHSTSQAAVHSMDHIFTWIADRPQDRQNLGQDPFLLQRFVHESLRLHPASPESRRRAECDVVLRSGRRIVAGSLVVIDLVAANRDPDTFGARPDVFDPARELPPEVAPWGLSFGTGFHACLGQELAAGAVPDQGASEASHLFGAVVAMGTLLLDEGARPAPDAPPRLDTASYRPHFGSFPVVLGP